MKKLSPFDIGMIIAFVVVALLGGGAWWYLSGQLATTQQDVGTALSDFQKYSNREVFLPTAANEKILHDNIDLMQSQLDPLVHDQLQPSKNKLPSVKVESPIDWKHDLDAEVTRLNDAAKLHGVTVPNNFYYGFSRYLTQNPGDAQTVVLGKQLLGVEEMASILVNTPVKTLSSLRRTYEEDPPSAMPLSRSGNTESPDLLPGNAMVAPGDVYTAYPFEIQFVTDTEGLRKILDALGKSPYVFVIRTLLVQNSNPSSPMVSDLQTMAGPPTEGVLDSNPGALAASKSSRGPQFLFGNETLKIKMRIDMIEWKGVATDAATSKSPVNRSHHRTSAGGNL